MRIGVSFVGADPQGLDRERMMSDARLAESVGFDSLWFFDALGRGHILPDPLIAVTVAALATQRIELGTCVMQVPLRRPAELAHRVLSAQLAADGRFVYGVGAGSTRGDFELVGADFDDRMQALDEGLGVMRKLWQGESHNGHALFPWEATRGGPPVLIGSWSGKRWIPRAARDFDGWIASGAKSSYEAVKAGIGTFRAEGGKRAVLTNIQYDFDAPTTELPDDGPFHLRCDLGAARERMQRMVELGYDDAVFMLSSREPAELEAIRGLVG